MADRWLTTAEAAAVLGITANIMRWRLKNGWLKVPNDARKVKGRRAKVEWRIRPGAIGAADLAPEEMPPEAPTKRSQEQRAIATLGASHIAGLCGVSVATVGRWYGADRIPARHWDEVMAEHARINGIKRRRMVDVSVPLYDDPPARAEHFIEQTLGDALTW